MHCQIVRQSPVYLGRMQERLVRILPAVADRLASRKVLEQTVDHRRDGRAWDLTKHSQLQGYWIATGGSKLCFHHCTNVSKYTERYAVEGGVLNTEKGTMKPDKTEVITSLDVRSDLSSRAKPCQFEHRTHCR